MLELLTGILTQQQSRKRHACRCTTCSLGMQLKKGSPGNNLYIVLIRPLTSKQQFMSRTFMPAAQMNRPIGNSVVDSSNGCVTFVI